MLCSAALEKSLKLPVANPTQEIKNQISVQCNLAKISYNGINTQVFFYFVSDHLQNINLDALWTNKSVQSLLTVCSHINQIIITTTVKCKYIVCIMNFLLLDGSICLTYDSGQIHRRRWNIFSDPQWQWWRENLLLQGKQFKMGEHYFICLVSLIVQSLSYTEKLSSTLIPGCPVNSFFLWLELLKKLGFEG